MRRPNPRLSDIGMGRDVVGVYAMTYAADAEGNPIRVVSGTPAVYTATVTPITAVGGEADGSEMSITTYSVMLYSDADPGVKLGDPSAWRGLVLRAISDATRDGPGAWSYEAAERGPDPDESGIPAGVPA